MQQVAAGVIVVGNVCAVGVVLAHEPAKRVVGIDRDRIARYLEDLPRAVLRIVRVIQRVAALIDGPGKHAVGIKRVGERFSARVVNACHVAKRIVRERGAAAGIGCRQELAETVVGVIVVAAVREAFPGDVSVAVVGERNRIAVALHDGGRLAGAVERKALLRAVDVQDRGRIAGGIVREARDVVVGVGDRGGLPERAVGVAG